MPNVDCRYFQTKLASEEANDDQPSNAGACAHPKMRRDNPDCEGCTVPLAGKHQLCPGVSQRYDAKKDQYRYRCTIHRVKISEPLQLCKSLRNCPLDKEDVIFVAPPSSSGPLIKIGSGTVAAAVARRIANADNVERVG